MIALRENGSSGAHGKGRWVRRLPDTVLKMSNTVPNWTSIALAKQK
jgi:hypothetical protein